MTLPFRNLRVLELLIESAASAHRPDDKQGQLFHRMLLDGDIIEPSAIAIDEYVPTDIGEAWLQALLDVEPPHRTRPKGWPGTGAAATVPPFAASRLEGKLDVILSRLEVQQKEVSHMVAAITAVQAAIAALSDKIAAESSVIDSAVALIEGFKDRIAGLITPRTDPDTVAQINHLLDTVGAEGDKLATAVAAGTMAEVEVAGIPPGAAYADPSPQFDGTNGLATENADYARGAADSAAGKAAADVPDVDRSNQAYTDGYFNASRAALNAGIDQANADPGVDPGTPDTIVPPSAVPPDAPADVPTPESVAGPDEQPPAAAVDPGTPAV